MTAWRKEKIPNEDLLFRRVHKNWIKDGELMLGVFKNIPGTHEMSVDWNQYSTPREALKRATDPAKNGIVEMVVGDVRNVSGQSVEHTPDQKNKNRAHTDILGEKDPEVRIKFGRIYRWVICCQE